MDNTALNIVLFALTGIGNTVLRVLAEMGQKPILVVTRCETGVFPYYPENQITEEAHNLGIPVLIGEDGEKETLRLKPDVIFSATYHRLISNEVISSAKYAFNLHPSLLPSYPGKNPFYGVLINDEPMTGVSIHRLTDKFDGGEVVFQKATKIRANETQGSLRLSLAKLAGEATKEFFGQLETLPLTAPPLGQSSGKKHFGQVNTSDRIIDIKNNAEIICRQIRALTPWPLAILEEADSTVKKVILVEHNTTTDVPPGTMLSISTTTARARVADAEIVFAIH